MVVVEAASIVVEAVRPTVAVVVAAILTDRQLVRFPRDREI